MDKAPVSKPEIAGSSPARDIVATVAQLAEHSLSKRKVVGSIPTCGYWYQSSSVDSLMVMISAFQAEGPGSIPGRRIFILFYYLLLLFFIIIIF